MAEDVPLHVVPKPEGTKTIDGVGSVTLTSFQTITCSSHSGTVTFSTTTTGTFQQTFTGCESGGKKCTTSGQGCWCHQNERTPLRALDSRRLDHARNWSRNPAHTDDLRLRHSHVRRGFPTTVAGNGLIGTITKPVCGSSSKEATIEFSSSSHGVQTHKTVIGTTTEYSMQFFDSPHREMPRPRSHSAPKPNSNAHSLNGQSLSSWVRRKPRARLPPAFPKRWISSAVIHPRKPSGWHMQG